MLPPDFSAPLRARLSSVGPGRCAVLDILEQKKPKARAARLSLVSKSLGGCGGLAPRMALGTIAMGRMQAGLEIQPDAARLMAVHGGMNEIHAACALGQVRQVQQIRVQCAARAPGLDRHGAFGI